MNKKIITIFFLLVAFAAVVATMSQEQAPPPTDLERPDPEVSVATPEPEGSAPSVPKSSRTPQETFQAYRDAARASNREAIIAVSWKVSDACARELTAECSDRMRAVVTATENMEVGQLTVVIADDKQAILATPVRFFETPDAYFAEQKAVYLARRDGSWRVAGIDSGRLWSVPRTAEMLPEEARKRLEADILDSDRDGVTDRMERCDLPPTMQWMQCAQTDPEKRDSKGDGWWDGMRSFVTR